MCLRVWRFIFFIEKMLPKYSIFSVCYELDKFYILFISNTMEKYLILYRTNCNILIFKVSSSDMTMYDDTISPIQGDPLLSETSSVIEAQKDIEIGSAAASSTERGSDVMNMVEQAWKTTLDPSTDSISQWGQ